MGEKLGIDEIIVMEDGKAEVKKSLPSVKEEPKPKHAKGRPAEPAGTPGPQQEPRKLLDVQEIIRNAKPPSKDDALSVIEAALFMSSRPIMLDELARISGINSLGYLKQMLENLQKDYGKGGMEIICGREGWHMQVRQRLLQHVAHLTPYSDIPEGCKRTLALIVYKEPMKQSDVIRVQGNKAYSYIKKLSKMGLVRAEKKGRTIQLKLTQEFERYFGDDKAIIRQSMIKEFGDPSKVFIEPEKPDMKSAASAKQQAAPLAGVKPFASAFRPAAQMPATAARPKASRPAFNLKRAAASAIRHAPVQKPGRGERPQSSGKPAMPMQPAANAKAAARPKHPLASLKLPVSPKRAKPRQLPAKPKRKG